MKYWVCYQKTDGIKSAFENMILDKHPIKIIEEKNHASAKEKTEPKAHYILMNWKEITDET